MTCMSKIHLILFGYNLTYSDILEAQCSSQALKTNNSSSVGMAWEQKSHGSHSSIYENLDYTCDNEQMLVCRSLTHI
jgi:hypothetical protein